MRRTGTIALLSLAACTLLAGCPSPWPKYEYDKLPQTVVRIPPGELIPSGSEPLSVDIRADIEWQDTGLTLVAGEGVTIMADGKWNPDVAAGDRDCGPRGYRNPTGYYVPEIRSLTYGALIGRVGNGKPFLVGAGGSFAATADGPLQMACNRSLRSTVLGRGEVTVKLYAGRTKSSLLGGSDE